MKIIAKVLGVCVAVLSICHTAEWFLEGRHVAKAAGIPDSQIDPEGWVGEMLYSMARGKEMLNNDMTYSRYGFETLLELEAIINGY